MKTHQLATALEQLATILRSCPNIEMPELQDHLQRATKLNDQSGIAVNLSTLAALSRLDRQEWFHFVRTYALPIEIRPRDASRDILGKLLKYLEENPEARKQLRNRAQHKEAVASPELMKALSLLLDQEQR